MDPKNEKRREPSRQEKARDRQALEADWGELMVAAQAGDTAAYDRLLREILPGLRALVGSRLRSSPSAEDVVQNVLLSLHRARHTYQPGRPLGPWLRAIARNAVADSLRASVVRGRREAPLIDADAVADTAEASPLTAPLSPRLADALASLPPAQREAVELIQLREFSVIEAAAQVGITPGALKVRAHRGYKRLRALLGAEAAEEEDR